MSEFERHVWNVEGECKACDWTADEDIAGDWSVENQCSDHAVKFDHEVRYTESYLFTKRQVNFQEQEGR